MPRDHADARDADDTDAGTESPGDADEPGASDPPAAPEASPSDEAGGGTGADRDAPIRVGVETVVPPGAEVHECAYCGRPFADAAYLALHRGLAHTRTITDAEWAAYEAARDAEDDEIRRYRIVALGLLVLVYFGFLFVYAAVG
jgi:hypothetical protein